MIQLVDHDRRCLTRREPPEPCNCTLGRDQELPFPYRSEIVPGLWQGMRPVESEGGYKPYGLVVNCETHITKSLLNERPQTFGFIHVSLVDDEVAFSEELVEAAGRAVAHAHSKGVNVLVHSAAGLNRSSLVTARALEYRYGWSGDHIADLIREKRDTYCLCNPLFEKWVRGL